MNGFLTQGGGYRNLRVYQLSEIIYDLTVIFSEKWVATGSRTRDQMVQAARSGKQNIAEGSAASTTSRETEIKLTNVAKASLEELLLDYEDYLRQNSLPQWNKGASSHTSAAGLSQKRQLYECSHAFRQLNECRRILQSLHHPD